MSAEPTPMEVVEEEEKKVKTAEEEAEEAEMAAMEAEWASMTDDEIEQRTRLISHEISVRNPRTNPSTMFGVGLSTLP